MTEDNEVDVTASMDEAMKEAGVSPSGEPITFDYDYVTGVRNEAKTSRLKLKPWRDNFGTYSLEDQEIIQNAFGQAASDDPEIAALGKQQIENIAAVFSGRESQDLSALLGTEDNQETQDPQDPAPKEQEVSDTENAAEVLTSETVAKIVAEALEAQNEKNQEDRSRREAISRLDVQLEELGYKPNSFEARMVLMAASEIPETEGNLEKADKYLKDRDQAAIDKILGENKKDEKDFPKTAPTTTATQSAEVPAKITTTEDAESAARADLLALMGDVATGED